MAISNSIGSNVFDILVGLGLPWLLQTLCIDYGSTVSIPAITHVLFFLLLPNIVDRLRADHVFLCPLQISLNSRGLIFSVALLLASVFLTVSTGCTRISLTPILASTLF